MDLLTVDRFKRKFLKQFILYMYVYGKENKWNNLAKMRIY